MSGAIDFDPAAYLAAMRAKRAPQPLTQPKAPNPPNRSEIGPARLGALGGLGGAHPQKLTSVRGMGEAPVAAPTIAEDCPPHHAAARLRQFLADGATASRCTSGAIDIELSDGRMHFISPSVAARMGRAGLLPPHVGGPPIRPSSLESNQICCPAHPFPPRFPP